MKYFLSYLLAIFSLVVLPAQNAQWKGLTAPVIITDMVERNGEIWTASQGGLNRYNPYTSNTQTYHQANSDLFFTNCGGLEVDKYNRLWIMSYYHDLACFNDTTFMNINQPKYADNSALPFNRMFAIDDTILWSVAKADTTTYLYRFNISNQPIKMDSVPLTGVPCNAYPTNITLDTFGNVWTCIYSTSNKGIYKYDGTTWTFMSPIMGAPYTGFQSVFCDKNNNLYFIRTDNFLYRYDGTTYSLLWNCPQNYMQYLNTDINGDIWLKAYTGTNGFLYRFDGTNFTSFNLNNVSLSPYFYSLTLDSQQNIWLGGQTDTLYQHNGNAWIKHDIGQNMLSSNWIADMAVNAQNGVWLAGQNALSGRIGLNYTDGINVVKASPNPIVYEAYACAAGANQDAWVMTIENEPNAIRLAHYDGNNWTNYNAPVSPMCIAMNKNNLLYVGDDSGNNIWAFDSDSSYTICPNNSSILSMVVDNNNVLWYMNNYAYLSKYDGVTCTGVASLNNLQEYFFQLYADSYNNLWAISQTIRRFDGQVWTIYYPSDFGSPNRILDMGQDNQGFYWFLNGNGLIKTDLNSHTYYPIPGDTTHGFFNKLIIDKAGNKWISGYNSQKGAFIFNENGIKHSPLAIPYIPVSGNIYFDENQNGAKENVEMGVMGQKVWASPDSIMLFSNYLGNYTCYTENGNHQLSFVPYSNNWVLTSDSPTYHIEVNDSTLTGFDFGVYPLVAQDSFSLVINASPFSCWVNSQTWIDYKNCGTNIRNGLITFRLDTNCTFVNAYPTPNAQNGNTYSWNFSAFQPMESRQILIQYQVQGPVAGIPWLGLAIQQEAELFYTQNGNYSFYTQTIYNDSVLCAYDPNDKTCHATGPTLGNLSLFAQPLIYTIRFQNTGNAPAYNVLIIDTLDSNLDINTFELIGASHSLVTQINEGRIVHFRFNNIMLPDSHSNESASHGYVSYAIKAKNSLPENTNILNSAAIYFDWNPPIITNTTQNELVSSLPISVSDDIADEIITVYPNPFQESTQIRFDNPKNELHTLLLFDIQGKCLYTNKSYSNHFDIEAKKLPQGIYFFQLLGEKKSYKGKLIKY